MQTLSVKPLSDLKMCPVPDMSFMRHSNKGTVLKAFDAGSYMSNMAALEGIDYSSPSKRDFSQLGGLRDAVDFLTNKDYDNPSEWLSSLFNFLVNPSDYPGVHRFSISNTLSNTVVLSLNGHKTVRISSQQGTVLKETFERIPNFLSASSNVYEYALNYCALSTYYQFYTDGNKRTSRLTMDYHLINNGYIPIDIPSSRISDYEDALYGLFVQGSLESYVSFLLSCASA